jgi:hypothetical protein
VSAAVLEASVLIDSEEGFMLLSRTSSLNSECSKKHLPCVPELLVIRTPRSTPMHQSNSSSLTKNHNNHTYKGKLDAQRHFKLFFLQLLLID